MTCAAAPSCGAEQVEVEACEESDESCQEVTLCEQTIYCSEEHDHEDHDHDGDHEDGDHEDGDHDDHDHDGDHEDEEVQCTAAPTCGPEQVEVEACAADDESCQEVSICEQTIFCTDAEE